MQVVESSDEFESVLRDYVKYHVASIQFECDEKFRIANDMAERAESRAILEEDKARRMQMVFNAALDKETGANIHLPNGVAEKRCKTWSVCIHTMCRSSDRHDEPDGLLVLSEIVPWRRRAR